MNKFSLIVFIIFTAHFSSAFTAPYYISYKNTPPTEELKIDELNGDMCSTVIDPKNLSKWFYSNDRQPKGTILLAHGINQFSSRPDALASALADLGYHVLRMSFSGHRGTNRDEFKRVNQDVFLNDLYASYLVTRTFAKQKNLPLFFIGYSLGGLMIQNLINKRPEIDFKIRRMILLAPAITIKPLYKKFAFLQKLIPDEFEVPLPAEVRSSQWQIRTTITMAGLRAGNFAIDENERLKYFASNRYETLVMIDPTDIAVPISLLRDITVRNNLTAWSIKTTPGKLRSPQLAHYLVERALYTEEEWKSFTSTIDTYFSSTKSE